MKNESPWVVLSLPFFAAGWMAIRGGMMTLATAQSLIEFGRGRLS